jgi:hypothetical protein
MNVWLCSGSTVVEYLTINPEIKGSNPATIAIFFQIFEQDTNHLHGRILRGQCRLQVPLSYNGLNKLVCFSLQAVYCK